MARSIHDVPCVLAKGIQRDVKVENSLRARGVQSDFLHCIYHPRSCILKTGLN